MTVGSRPKAAIALALMLAAFAGAHAWRPTTHLTQSRPKVELEALFPKVFGDWSLDTRMPVQMVSPDMQEMLNKLYGQTLSRTYVNGRGDRVMLSVAYGGDQSDATRTHRPEVCYPAQGFEVTASRDDKLNLGGAALRVRHLVARNGGRVEPITFWIAVGDKVVLSGTEQKLAQLSYSSRGIIPDGMLVRVSTIDPNPEAAFTVHQQFVTQLSRAMVSAQRAQVFGAVGS